MISTTEKTTPNITTPSLNITLTKKPMDKAISLQLCALAANKEPDNPELQAQYGTQLLIQDNHTLAYQAFKQALSLSPNHLQARIGYAKASYLLGDRSQTLQDYLRETLAIEPGSIATRHQLTRLLKHHKLHNPLKKLLTDTITQCTRQYAYTDMIAQCLELLTRILVKDNQLAQALRWCDTSLSLQPFNTAAMAIKSQLLFLAGEHEAANQIANPASAIITPNLWPELSPDELKQFHSTLMCEFDQENPTYELKNVATRKGFQGLVYHDLSKSFRVMIERIMKQIEQTSYTGSILKGLMQHEKHSFDAHCVKLCNGGYQETHFHPFGSISGVYYIQTKTDTSSPQGYLELASKGRILQEYMRTCFEKKIQVNDGMLVLFPSWLYHRTIPTEINEFRYSLAFDLRPILQHST